jgi:hypothetical protein
MRDWIESHGYTTYKKFYGGGPAVKCEIDIVIPDARLSVEYHGDILHSEFIKNRGCGYHLNKTVQSKRRDGYHLIHVFESEWKHNKDQVKAFILGYLTKGVPIRASKCEVKEIDNNLAYDFCNQYHLQGKPHGAILSLGLYYQNELLSVMTFSKPHRQNMGSEPHLSRYVTKTGFRVHGGLSKLSQYAYSKLGEFITFVHLRLSSGDSYLKAGYEAIKTLPPDYWYWDYKKNKKVLKQARRKSAVNTPEGMTESEHAKADGLYRIWDCGKIKLKFSMKKSDKIV